jgi:hypothetical protein
MKLHGNYTAYLLTHRHNGGAVQAYSAHNYAVHSDMIRILII